MLELNYIKKSAHKLGFSLCGVAPYQILDQQKAHLELWLSQGHQSVLSYLERNIDIRSNPSLLLENTRSIIVCAVNYKNDSTFGQNLSSKAKVASYAMNADYHFTIKAMLAELEQELKSQCPELNARACVDSAPIFEKAWAVEAGLGTIGRNSLLLTPQYGSTILLGELLIDQTVDSYDSPLEWNPCQECDLCVRSCPNGAINQNRTLDTHRCISALTTEPKHTAIDPKQLSGWVFGCDVCQRACPHNRSTPQSEDVRFQPIISREQLSKEFWRDADKPKFKLSFAKTPLFRTKFAVLQQRIAEQQN